MKKLHISMAGKRAVNGYLFILPWLLGFLLFYVRSLYMTVEFSLSDLTVLSTGGYNLEFVGLKNYYEAFFSHASFKQTLTTSIGNMVIDVPLIIFFSLFVAMMLNRKMKCRGLVRAIFFLPVLLGAEAVSNALSLAAQMMAGGLSGTSADMAAASASSGTMNMDYLIDLFAQLALPDVVLITSSARSAASAISFRLPACRLCCSSRACSPFLPRSTKWRRLRARRATRRSGKSRSRW